MAKKIEKTNEIQKFEKIDNVSSKYTFLFAILYE